MKTILFDLDGTLSESREKISSEVAAALEDLSRDNLIGIVSGSGIDFISEQIEKVFSEDFMEKLLIMPCNGTQRYTWVDGHYTEVFKSDMIEEIGKINYSKLLSRLIREQHEFIMDNEVSLWCTGKFFDYRVSMLNWSPMGRNGTKREREIFVEFDKKKNYRIKILEEISNYFKSQSIELSIKLGGDTSFDIYPTGWDKTFCLRHVKSLEEDVYFFGDRCFPGGNDHELYKRLGKSYHVNNPRETLEILKSIKF